MNKNRILSILRFIILLCLLVFTTAQGRLHQILKIYPAVDAFCPFGGLESLWALIRYQGLLRRVAWSSIILLATTVGTALVFRRSFCGNICPLGFLQELFGMGGKAVLKRRFNLPGRLDRILRYAKYPVLLLFLGLAWKTLALAIRPYDPWVAYHHLGSGELFSEYLIGLIILALSLGGALFVDRPFCRYLCPMGGFLALPSFLGFSRIRRKSETCIDCGICDASCPMDIDVSSRATVKSPECISCTKCVQACPVEGTLEFSTPSFRGKSQRLPSALILFGTLGIFLIVLTAATLTEDFLWKADTGLERRQERLLWGPQRIGDDNTPAEVIGIYQIHPDYFVETYGIEREEQFYMTFEELGINARELGQNITKLFQDAGMDPRALFAGGGGCSEGH